MSRDLIVAILFQVLQSKFDRSSPSPTAIKRLVCLCTQILCLRNSLCLSPSLSIAFVHRPHMPLSKLKFTSVCMYSISLIPRLSPPPVFDCLECALIDSWGRLR